MGSCKFLSIPLCTEKLSVAFRAIGYDSDKGLVSWIRWNVFGAKEV